MITLILAGNYKQAMEYAAKNKLHHNNWSYISDALLLMGMQDCELRLVGTFRLNPIWDSRLEIQSYCVMHNIKILKEFD